MLDRTPDVTRLLDRLERAGLIERERSELDRRVVEVGITEKGMNLLCEMNDEIRAVEEHLVRHLSAGELKQLSELLEKLRTDQEA